MQFGPFLRQISLKRSKKTASPTSNALGSITDTTKPGPAHSSKPHCPKQPNQKPSGSHLAKASLSFLPKYSRRRLGPSGPITAIRQQKPLFGGGVPVCNAPNRRLPVAQGTHTARTPDAIDTVGIISQPNQTRLHVAQLIVA